MYSLTAITYFRKLQDQDIRDRAQTSTLHHHHHHHLHNRLHPQTHLHKSHHYSGCVSTFFLTGMQQHLRPYRLPSYFLTSYLREAISSVLNLYVKNSNLHHHLHPLLPLHRHPCLVSAAASYPVDHIRRPSFLHPSLAAVHIHPS